MRPREGRVVRFAWSGALLLAIPPIILVMVALLGRTVLIAIVLLAAGPTYPETAAIEGVLLSTRVGASLTIMWSASALVAPSKIPLPAKRVGRKVTTML